MDADDAGYHKIFMVNVNSQAVSEVVSTGDNLNLVVTQAGIYYTRNTLRKPSDVRPSFYHSLLDT